ncbi:MAG: SAM-dependent methyltransferase [Planctomycetia bacterium]
MSDQGEELYQFLRGSVRSGSLRKAVFSGQAAPSNPIIRVDVRPVEIRGVVVYQFASRTKTQEFHCNRTADELLPECRRLLEGDFRNVRLEASDGQIEGNLSKNGHWALRRKSVAPPANTVSESHNAKRNYLIPDGIPCPFLIHTGVMSPDGTVRATQFRKFRQINRFLEFIKDIVSVLPHDRPIQVIDFGCGKSYLTFATHYLLTQVLQRPCQILGLDRREDVVATCNQIREELKLDGLSFQTGEISGFCPEVSPDLVISLHACDTATDDALAQSVQWGATVILAVPCCQHEMNQLLQGSPLSPLTSYGITRERFCTLATDSMRASLMAAVGYQSQVLEFIDMEHTPKNLLLRCVRRPAGKEDRRVSEQSSLLELVGFRRTLNLPALTLERRLSELGLLKDRPENSGLNAARSDFGTAAGSPEVQS